MEHYSLHTQLPFLRSTRLNLRSKVLVFSGSRADYWILEPLIDAFLNREFLQVFLGHLGPYDSTNSSHIAQSRRKRDLKVSVIENKSLPQKFEDEIVFSKAFEFANLMIERTRPDVVIYLGDRIEIMAASAASHLSRVPSVHLHGGESSLGSLDDSMRHAITKLSKGHIAFSESALRNLKRLGEAEPQILLADSFLFSRLERTSEEKYLETLQDLGFSASKNLAIVTVHPVTTDEIDTRATINSVVSGVLNSDLEQILLTGPNTDRWRDFIIEAYETLLAKSQQSQKIKVVWVPDLGGDVYLSLLARANVCIGNSSSGVLEAPLLGIQVVDVGKRQLGRVWKGSGVRHVEAIEADVGKAIALALASRNSRIAGSSKRGSSVNRVVDWVLSNEFPFEKLGLLEGSHIHGKP